MNLFKDIPAGTAEEINVIVEIPKGSKNKYEVNKKFGIIALDRVMHTTQDCPFDYGFVPQTLWDDGDPLDVLILTTHPLAVGVLVAVRPVAIMDMVDSGEGDAKIIAVPVSDPRWSEIKDLKDVNKHTLKEMEHYFTTYKKLQNKEVVVRGFSDKSAAVSAFQKAVRMYNDSVSIEKN